MITYACVLRSGGPVYNAEWVRKLSAQVAQHASRPHRFVCLSDVDVPCERIPLVHDWPGWYSKLELFRPGLFRGPVIYLDLDTLVVGDLGPIEAVADGPFAMLSDFYRLERPASGVMTWVGTNNMLWDAMVEYSTSGAKPQPRRRLDHWLEGRVTPRRLQDLAPGCIVSFKAHAKHAIPEGASLVCGHGQPRFSDPRAGWAHRRWSDI